MIPINIYVPLLQWCISTQQAIITLVNKITSSLDTGDLVIGVFLDLKKVFGTIDHTILLDKMHAYGTRGNILRWFRSYLTNQSQFVSYDDRQSAIQSITCGVPQGSILGPLLFIIYMIMIACLVFIQHILCLKYAIV